MDDVAPGHLRYTGHLPVGEHLPVPDMAGWDIFPFEGDLRVKALEPPVVPEPPRRGEGGVECGQCGKPDSEYLWTDDHWRLAAPDQPTGAPVVLVLESREHHDSPDLPEALAAELGVVLQRIERAVLSLDGIARVHMNRWGDGGSHLHWWLFARPEGMMQLRGTCLAIWDDILPPRPRDEWAADLATVAAAMAAHGGTSRS